MGEKKSFNSEHKLLIREFWNKPLLKFLAKRQNQKLIYLGLPSPEAEDIKEWIDYIDSIIAFQCRVYDEASNPEQSRNCIEKLEKYLKALERQDKINNYVVYDGYLEEVVLQGFDNSGRNDLDISQFITLYNLDFCNKISSPHVYLDRNGDTQKVYKFEAISKLLEFQKSLSTVSRKFILFLTVHCSYEGKELQHFISNPQTEEIKTLLNNYTSLKGVEKNERIIRLFVIDWIKKQYETYGFSPKILPVIRYDGLGSTPLIHFAVLGIQEELTGGTVQVYQSLSEIVNQRFINIENNSFVNSSKIHEFEVETKTDPVAFFTESKTYKKLWL